MTDLEKESARARSLESGVENREKSTPESGVETEENFIRGAEMLENPPDGSFVHGLQLFIAWVKSIVADD